MCGTKDGQILLFPVSILSSYATNPIFLIFIKQLAACLGFLYILKKNDNFVTAKVKNPLQNESFHDFPLLVRFLGVGCDVCSWAECAEGAARRIHPRRASEVRQLKLCHGKRAHLFAQRCVIFIVRALRIAHGVPYAQS